jgi:hypothetical protein
MKVEMDETERGGTTFRTHVPTIALNSTHVSTRRPVEIDEKTVRRGSKDFHKFYKIY